MGSSVSERRTSAGDRTRPTRSEEEDRALVLAHRAGDPDAFSVIFARHDEQLLAQARRLLGPGGAAEDACQETFRRALEGIGRFGRSGEWHLGAWLSTILRRVCVDQLERTRRDRLLAAAISERSEQELDVANQITDPVRVVAARDALGGLRPPLRRALLMREFFGQSYAEVAAAEHITEQCARTRASRARRTLQRRLAS